MLCTGIMKSTLAGDMLTDVYLKILEQKGKAIRPHYMIESKKEIRPGEFEVHLRDLGVPSRTTESFRLYMMKQVVRDLKETVCRVSDVAFDEEANANIPTIPYELPDGNVIEVGTDRFKLPELMFSRPPADLIPVVQQFMTPDEPPFAGVQQLIVSSIGKCDPDIRRELYSSIIVTGGNTILPQFPERLHKELQEKAATQQMYKVKLVATSSVVERKFSVWIGGSILASLGTFQQMWMSKQEYDEHGKSLVERKCP